MRADVDHEQRFIAEFSALEFAGQDIGKVQRALRYWLARLNTDLQAHHLTCTGLAQRSPLVRRAEAVNDVLRNGARAWSEHAESWESASVLAEQLDDKVVLLVFGKFNAGKSSLCNLLAERFSAYGKAVEYFYVDAGRIVEASAQFGEGATETTAQLQGVRLGEKLVLLDTPGLHSVTPENAALTQRFTESADAVLWLTSSASPGQVQELDELSRELHRNKPLLPVVTRSDLYEEDEVDGELHRVLCNKTAQNRAEQEADVKSRAEEKLRSMGVDAAQLSAPVSISVRMVREQGQSAAALREAGFERLYSALCAITEPTLSYKRRKHAEIVLHHLEDNVLRALHRENAPLLGELKIAVQAALESLETKQTQIDDAVWRRVIPQLPELLEKHSAARDVRMVCDELEKALFEAFLREANEKLAEFHFTADASLASIKPEGAADFEEVMFERTGSGENLVHLSGVDYTHLAAALKAGIGATLQSLSGDVIAQCRASIERLSGAIVNMEESLQFHELELRTVKSTLRR